MSHSRIVVLQQVDKHRGARSNADGRRPGAKPCSGGEPVRKPRRSVSLKLATAAVTADGLGRAPDADHRDQSQDEGRLSDALDAALGGEALTGKGYAR